MQSIRAIGVLALLVLGAIGVPQGDPWDLHALHQLRVDTTAGEKTGTRRVLRVFEEVRSAFRDILGVKLVRMTGRSTIIAFRDELEYTPYRFMPAWFAYYMPVPGHDFIVIQDLLPEHYPKILHEYTHLVINQAGMKLPLWLNEGLRNCTRP